MVGMDDALAGRFTGGFRFPINGPPDRFSRTRVQDHTGLTEAFPRGMFRNVGHP